MSHAFDTGLSGAQRTLLRNGAVAVLAGLMRQAGGYLQAVIPWGGVIRGHTDEIGIDELHAAFAGRSPAIAIALGDCALEPAGIGGFNFKGSLELLAYHYSNHPRDLEAGRLAIDAAGLTSDVADPGLDVIMEHTAQLLIGQRAVLGATVKQIVPTREEELRTENAFSLWVQRYAVTVTRNINANRGLTQLLEEIRTNVRADGWPTTAIAAAPIGATQVGSLATFTTSADHGLAPGNLVIVDGVAIAGYNGALHVVATPTATTFTAQLPVAGLAASGGGTVSQQATVDLQNLLPP